jgi:hypothetical protein
MNSTMKTALPIGLVVLMVFGVTFMSQFTAPPAARIDDDEPETELPLKTGSAELRYDPMPPPNLWYHRFFPGNFEVGSDGTDNRFGFIIRNARRSSVFLAALTPSCSTCTSARAAVFPADALNSYFQTVAAGTMPSAMPIGDLTTAIAWASLRQKIVWHEFTFNDPANKFELPGATEQGETWGLLELGFKVTTAGTPSVKSAFFDLYNSKGEKLSIDPFPFSVMFGGRDAQEVFTTDFRLPELSDANPAHAFEVICVSATRSSLPPPTLSANGDPHIVITKPIPLGAEELQALSRAASARAQSGGVPTLVSYKCGYRIQAMMHRDANGKSLDVGPYERTLVLGAGPGVVIQKPPRLHVRGEVVGAVRLEGASAIEFGSYNGDFAQKKEVRLWTERKGIELEVDPKLSDPNFLKATVGPPVAIADRTYWTLTVQIAAKEGKRPPWEGSIFLKAKGEKPFNIRIQTTGHGR